MSERDAIRAVVRGRVQGVGFRDATLARARALGLWGWVRNADDGTVAVHAEGPPAALAELAGFLREGPSAARVEGVDVAHVAAEGHEQFAVRGVIAGPFLVVARARGFELRLEVTGAVRAWSLSREPSLDPTDRRLAIEVPQAEVGSVDGARAWDRGTYEQGGRVPWPQALARGHAVFVLHGATLRGGFALQRTHAGPPGRWLLVKRRDEHARPGANVRPARRPT